MNKDIEKAVEGANEVVKTIPELYKDVFQPAAREIGKTMAVIPQTINTALLPLRKYNLIKEYNFAETQLLLEKKLKNIEANNIVTPEPYVAVPAIQALSYSMDSDELRDMYANLLAKSMCKDTKEYVHPSFVEIIKQLAPMDARIFKFLLDNEKIELVGMYVKEKPKTNKIELIGQEKYVCGIEKLTIIEFASYDDVYLSLDNLYRLRLVEDRFGDNEVSQEFKNSSNYKKIKSEYDKVLTSLREYGEDSSHLMPTKLGKLFGDICIN